MHAFFQDGPVRCSGGTCVCGAAVQSGPELFIYDRCDGKIDNNATRIGFLDCDDNRYMNIKRTGKNYEVSKQVH